MKSNDGSSGSLEFPSAVWPLHCREDNGNLAKLVPFDQGTSERLLPQINSDGQVAWQPASLYHMPDQEFMVQGRDPVLLRPRTRIPELLKRPELRLALTSSDNYTRQISYFQEAYRELDIPYMLLKDMFCEDAVDKEWDRVRITDGNLIAVCRPELDRDAPISVDAESNIGSKWYRQEQFRRNVKRVETAESWSQETQYAWSSKHEWMLYAGGECGNRMFGMPLPTIGDNDQAADSAIRLQRAKGTNNIDVVPAIELTTPIKQIVSRPEHPGYACVRNMSMVALLSIAQKPDRSTGAPLLEANIAGNPYSFGTGDQWTSHMSWSPWDMSQSVLASSTGCARLWDFERNRETLIEEEHEMPFEWNICEYWNSPRHILRANPDEVYFLDTRSDARRVSVLDLRESQFAIEGEIFTAVVPSKMHPMHAVAASTHAIRVFDQRYLSQPVMAWRHNCVKDDPPVFLDTAILPHSSYNQSAVVVAASRESSEIRNFVYGQAKPGGPFISIEQSMLKDAGPILNSFRDAVQEPLAVDGSVDRFMYNGSIKMTQRPAEPMVGMALHTFPDHIDNGVLSGVCVTVDESSAIVGHHVSLLADADTEMSESVYDKAIAECWKDVRLSDDGLVTDCMGFTLATKESRDHKREWCFDLMRSHGLPFYRINIEGKYKALVGVVSKADNSGFMRFGTWRPPKQPSIASSEATMFDLVQVALLSGAGKQIPANELPSWTASGVKLRDTLLRIDPGTVRDAWEHSGVKGLLELAAKSESANTDDNSIVLQYDTSDEPVSVEAAESNLKAIFRVEDKEALASALERAAKDVELAGVRINIGSGETSHRPEQDPSSVLQSKIPRLTKHAQLLQKLWHFDPMTDADSSQSQQQPTLSYRASNSMTKHPKKPKRRGDTATQETQPLTEPELPFTSASPLASAKRARQANGVPSIVRAAPTFRGPPQVVFSQPRPGAGLPQAAGSDSAAAASATRVQASETQLTAPDFFSQLPLPTQPATQRMAGAAQSQRVTGTTKPKKKKRRSGF